MTETLEPSALAAAIQAWHEAIATAPDERVADRRNRCMSAAISAYLAALASPAPQPVAWQYRYRHKNPNAVWSGWQNFDLDLSRDDDYEVQARPLYASPAPTDAITEAQFHAAAQAWFAWEKEQGVKDFPEQLRAALSAALASPAPTDEMVLVPRKPTKAMLMAIAHADWTGKDDLTWADGYRIMLDAAPRSRTGEGE